ncbi:hypothetical protein ZWY2020_051604 [Hordeum vulgare]|nr:hypothetical protein ZWY2020_051604 [Hordeum vulgare]
MARHSLFFFFLALSLQHLHISVGLPGRSLATATEQWQPMQCDAASLNASCSSYLYVTPQGRSLSEIASLFNGSASRTQPIKRLSGSEDLLVPVPCMCDAINDNMSGLFHDTAYKVNLNDTADNINSIFSGLAWNITATANTTITVHLLCGCSSTAPEGVISYMVQARDTLSNIATLFRSGSSEILSLNAGVTDPDFLQPGWILFIPMGVASSSKRKFGGLPIIIAVSISAAIMLLCTLTIVLRLRRRSLVPNAEVPKKEMERVPSNTSIAILESRYFPSKRIDDIDPFQTERPVIFSLKAVGDATANFDEKRKIGEGGYGMVYLGFIGTHEIAVKMMKDSKSKEFFAELKVLCKVHHINVVELIGYASGEDHLYLVYEYVQNGSLSEHLHDPLLKGHQPLSWTARTQIATDAARGIEYIHDHTKACYVHRDIKTSNILLDDGLRAKVADFGLVKLVERSDEEDCLATRLVGTPGYLPPESVRELHMTTKSDVYAFGVVLAELITGLRALVRDNKEANKTKSLISTLANISMWCLSEDPLDRPEMREIMPMLSRIHLTSIEWEARRRPRGL